MSPLLDGLAGLATGVLSGMGVGGGTLLMLYMTELAGFSQITAQGINLLYFLPSAATALPVHAKNGCLDWKLIVSAAVPGALVSVATAFLATRVDTELLRRFWGFFLIFVGVVELFKKEKKGK